MRRASGERAAVVRCRLVRRTNGQRRQRFARQAPHAGAGANYSRDLDSRAATRQHRDTAPDNCTDACGNVHDQTDSNSCTSQQSTNEQSAHLDSTA
jgi:hypothetical protein